MQQIFFEGCCVYLLNHLPVEDQVVRGARYAIQFEREEIWP